MDPFREHAEQIIAQSEFQRAITQILNDVGAAGQIRNRLEQEAIDFGPTLDLIGYRAYAQENVDRIPVAQDLDEALDDAFPTT